MAVRPRSKVPGTCLARAWHRPRFGWVLLLAAAPLVGQIAAAAQPPAAMAAASAEYFEAKVRPVLAANCYDCHTEESLGGLRLDSRESILKGGKSGPAIVPGDPDKSLLVAAIREARMPKDGHLQPNQIEDLVSWVKDGAYWPESAATQAGGKPYTITAAQRQLWS